MSTSVASIAGGGRIKELDGWRAISVLLVVVHHLGAFQYAEFTAPHLRIASFLRYCGPLGVRVFFVISGFVICRLLILEERRFGAVSLRGFYIRRVFRILPPYCFCLASICLLFSLQWIVGSWPAILTAAIFLSDFHPLAIENWFTGHTWSLAVEEQFYLIFPTLWVLTRGAARRYLFLIFLSILAAWSVCAGIFNWNWLTTPAVRTGFTCIACGVVMAMFESRARAIARAVPGIAMAAIAFGLLWEPQGYSGWKPAFYQNVYAPPAIALLLIFSVERGGLLSKFLRWGPVQAVGLTSYGIYLWQQLFTAPAKDYTAVGKPIALFLPLLFVIIPFSWFFIEKPAMRIGKSLANRVRQEAVSETAVL